MKTVEGPYSFKGVDGLKTPVYIYQEFGEKKIIGEATVKVDGEMIFDVRLEEEYKDVEMGSFEVPMRYTYLNLPEQLQMSWGNNCLTAGIHDGRPEAIWNLPLLQTTHMFTPEQLKELVVDRIYNDAMEWVEHGNEPRLPKAWAERVKELAEPMVLPTYYQKLEEIADYYRSPGFKGDIDRVIERNKVGKLNPGYKPTHSHDTINLLCRIVGADAARQTSEEFAN